MAASIIISSYNQPKSVVEILQKLQQEAVELDLRVEIIIADDGSNESNVSYILQNSPLNVAEQVEINLTWQEDKGFRLAKSRNNALRVSSGEILIFIDGDCIPSDGFIDYHLKFHSHNPLTICVGKREYKPCLSEIYADNNQLYEQAQKNEESTIKYLCRSKIPWKAVIGRNFSVPRAEPMIYFDNRMLGWGGEDLGYALALKKAGLEQVGYESRAVVTQFGALQSGNPVKKEAPLISCYTQINHLLMMRDFKNDPLVYTELAKYLMYYRYTYSFLENDYCYDKSRVQGAESVFSLSISLQDATSVFKDAQDDILSYSKINNKVGCHPGFDELFTED